MSTFVLAALAVLVPSMAFGKNTPVNGAVFTTVNPAIDNSGHCLNGGPGADAGLVNCNIYDGKEFVWLSGGPDGNTAALSDGTYFFAVLVPGGQGNNSDNNPNDGTEKNLSDLAPTSGTGAGDAWTNRVFSINDGSITYPVNDPAYTGTHTFANNKIRLMPYDDTTNPGGEYILAVCNLAGKDYTATYQPGVNPSDCKYDAFKVKVGDEVLPPSAPGITKDAIGAYDNTYTWTIAKAVDQTRINKAGTTNQSGADATFNYTVTVEHDGGVISDVKVNGTITVSNLNIDSNNNIIPVAITGVTDQLSGSTAVCTVTSGGAQTLAQAKTSFAYECSLSGLPQGELDNVATVTWAEQSINDQTLAAGSASFTFSNISFAENTIDGSVNVTDSYAGDLGTVLVGDANPKSFTYARLVTGTPGKCTTVDNTATFTTNTSGATGSNSKTVELCVGADLQVSKTATPSFTRTYTWDISKAADKPLAQQIGGSATFNYTVRAWQTGFTDSGWALKGTITVTNPNDWEPITADITDAADVGGGVSCTVTDGTGVVIPEGGIITRDYSCTFTGQPTYTGTNTATATWDAGTSFTTDGSASGAAPVNFTNPTTVNKSIHVTDSYAGTLGTLTATDASPFASATYTYSRTVSVPTWDCVTYPNTATITETGLSASQSVKVCGPAKTGALTIGFWKTTNGQNLITTYCQNPALANYLKGLGNGDGPFINAPTTSCKALANYVSSILTGATATNMNTMLKAQMLGTALDLWFSGPGWTSTTLSKIKPPSNFLLHNSLDAFNMDTTAICPMVDNSSTGTAACQNNTPSTDAKKSGAVPSSAMTMQAILNFAATTSYPFSNGIWYGIDRTKQEILKNIFDQVNNQIAFAAQ
ncbi:MAG: hypothetical protein WCI67_11225 [Chloroflexales bacterium]